MIDPSQPGGPVPGAASPQQPPTAPPGLPAGAEPRVTVGRLVGHTFASWRACLVPFAVLSLLHQGAVFAIGWALGSPVGLFRRSPLQQTPEMAAWAFSGGYWAYVAAAMLVAVAVMGGLTAGAVQHLAGRPVTVGGMLGAMARRALTLVVAGALALLAIYLGLILLVVPGVLWGLSYSLVAPVVLAEELGPRASLRRSRALAKGSRWTLLGTYAVCGLAAAAPSWIGMGLSFAAPLAGGLITLLGSVILGPIALVAPAVAYHDLRVAKEGASSEELARVFA